VRADRPLLRGGLTIDEGEHCAHIVHHRRDGHLRAHRPHAFTLRAALLEHIGAKDRVAAGAVIQVGQQHVVADRAEAARHVPQFLADAWRIHQHEHGWERTATVRMADECLHRASLGRDGQGLFDHCTTSIWCRWLSWQRHIHHPVGLAEFLQSERRFVEFRGSPRIGDADRDVPDFAFAPGGHGLVPPCGASPGAASVFAEPPTS
jgi:hypothetical protein